MSNTFSQIFPYKVALPVGNSSWNKRAERYDWCVETFGNSGNWDYGAESIGFRHQEDAALFTLRWL